MQKKIVHVVSSIGNSSGGIGRVVLDHARLSGDVVSIISGDRSEEVAELLPEKIQHFFAGCFGLQSFFFQPKLLSLLRTLRPDIIHCHNVWQYSLIAAMVAHYSFGAQIVVTVHGMLDKGALKFSPIKKRLLLAIYGRRVLGSAMRVHCLTDREQDSIKQIVGKARTVVIPNPLPKLVSRRSRGDNVIRFIYVGRYHPKKNLEALLDGFAIAQPALGVQIELSLFGWGEPNFVKILEEKARSAAMQGRRCTVNGPIFSPQKDFQLSSSDCFILPSLSEGHPVALMEAFAFGLNVICSDECNLIGAFQADAAIESGTEPRQIADSIEKFASLSPDDRAAQRDRGCHWATQKFSEETIKRAIEGRLYGGDFL